MSDPSDGDVRTLVRHRPRAALGVRERERLEPLVGTRQAAGDHRWRAHRDGTRLIVHQHHHVGGDDIHPIDGSDLVGRRQRHRGACEPAELARGVTDRDLVGVVGGPSRHEGVDLVGHRAEHDEGPDPDRDPEDRQDGPDGAAPQVPQVAHRTRPHSGRGTADLRSGPRSGRSYRRLSDLPPIASRSVRPLGPGRSARSDGLATSDPRRARRPPPAPSGGPRSPSRRCGRGRPRSGRAWRRTSRGPGPASGARSRS